MISPETGDNYLKCILLCFRMEHWVWPCNMIAPKYMPYVFYQVLWKFYLYGDCVNFGKKNSGVHLNCLWQNMNKKHGAKNLAMSTEQMQDIFSPMFFLCSQGEHLGCFWERKKCPVCAETFYKNIFPVFMAELCVIVTIKNTEDVIPEDTGKTLKKIYLTSVQ